MWILFTAITNTPTISGGDRYNYQLGGGIGILLVTYIYTYIPIIVLTNYTPS